MINSVYFFCCPSGPPENIAYLHNIVALAEGLQELNIKTFSNIDYWKTGNSYLLNRSDVDFRSCDVVFIDAAFYDMGFSGLLPEDLYNKNKNYKLVYNDNSDGLHTNGFSDDVKTVDIVLKSHYSTKYVYPENFVPWQFGLTSRIIEQVKPLPYKQRKKEFLNNFRVAHPLRDIAQEKIAPIFRKVLNENNTTDSFTDVENMGELDYSYWHQTGRRHYPGYYKRLSESYSCFCFGGNPQKRTSGKKGFLWDLIYRIDWHFPFLKYKRIYQWDSWRIWESLVAGCCIVHVDFEKYGLVLPVMPINGQHYLGFDLDNVLKVEKLIKKDPDIFERIGNNGREWVLKYYSPKKVAERFIALFNK